jgi:hypothetical protein
MIAVDPRNSIIYAGTGGGNIQWDEPEDVADALGLIFIISEAGKRYIQRAD